MHDITRRELTPEHSRQKSFYGKAVVCEDVNTETGEKITTLTSYATTVAFITNDETITYTGWYSATTAKHIQEFAAQSGFKCGGKQWIMENSHKRLDRSGEMIEEN